MSREPFTLAGNRIPKGKGIHIVPAGDQTNRVRQSLRGRKQGAYCAECLERFSGAQLLATHHRETGHKGRA